MQFLLKILLNDNIFGKYSYENEIDCWIQRLLLIVFAFALHIVKLLRIILCVYEYHKYTISD